ncbi:hypothetical protein OE88DRAFT_1635123 [Heliocybe sulcata]|uniref:Uncharacterized protein n=1 Tax=Heliocybe sulcata TaxID=5364 RepID=A0A5C3MU92_9AGAM|nr:hypothetical protein OE88DRAFT_1635123 [Heliocybe sulcata]
MSLKEKEEERQRAQQERLQEALLEGDRALGLYDDPEDGDELQYNLAAQLEHEQDDSLSESSSGQRLLPDTISRADVKPLPARALPRNAYMDSHSHWFVRLVLLLVIHLQTVHHVTFRACAIILYTLRLIFICMGALSDDDPMPVTYQKVIRDFGLEDRFSIHPACPDCHCLFSPDLPADARCPGCDTALFMTSHRGILRCLWDKAQRRTAPKPPPAKAVPIATLSTLLADFLEDNEIETACEQWLDHTHERGKYRNRLDGEVARTVKDENGKLFFSRDSHTEADELRIPVDFSADWYVVAPIFLYQTRNLLVPVALPGPTEPTAEQLQSYLKFLVDDLELLYGDGIYIPTAKYPEGK